MVTSSRAPGAACMKAEKALERARTPTSRREPTTRAAHSSSAHSGSMVVAHSPSSRRVSPPRGLASTPKTAGARACPLASASITRRPARAAAIAVASATVVLPTPPLPVTKTSSRCRSDDIRASG